MKLNHFIFNTMVMSARDWAKHYNVEFKCNEEMGTINFICNKTEVELEIKVRGANDYEFKGRRYTDENAVCRQAALMAHNH